MNTDAAKGFIFLYGIEAHGVSSGKTAIEVVRTSNICYDMIVMDHMMPEMSGVDAARIIRSQIDSDYTRTVPIVMFTANAIPENEKTFLDTVFIIKKAEILRRCLRNPQTKGILELFRNFSF
jgi:CheY-like chemotaxis protein